MLKLNRSRVVGLALLFMLGASAALLPNVADAVTGLLATAVNGTRYIPQSARPDNLTTGRVGDWMYTDSAVRHWNGSYDEWTVYASPQPSPALSGQCVKVAASGKWTIGACTGGGIAVGDPVSGGDLGGVMFTDPSGNLATSPDLIWDSGQLTVAGTVQANAGYLLSVGFDDVDQHGFFDGTGNVLSATKIGQSVASSGAGAQNTTIATYTATSSGLYLVFLSFSCTTADTVSAQVTYTDAVNTTAQTTTVLSSVACGTNGTANATPLQIRANTSTPILGKITLSSQATTKAHMSLIETN
jgi:hypothetical protein